MEALHQGKQSEELKINLPIAMHRHIKEMASRSQCFASEVVVDAIFLSITGKTYSEHVANDRRALFDSEVPDDAATSARAGGQEG